MGVTTPAGGTHFFPLRVRGYDEPLPAEGAYLADFLTDLAVRFIEEHRKGPFFLELNHLIPHWRIEAKERTIAKYRAKPKPLSGTNNPKYAAMFEHLDDSVGRVLKTIERLGLSEKTIVVFTSDNGAIYFRPNGEGADGAITTNAPLRGEKGSLYEGGIRVPQIVRWSKVVPPGTLTRTPAIGMDLLPTFAEVSGATLPDQSLDGVSLVPVLSGTGTLQRRDLFWHYPHYHHDEPSGAIREGDWKLKESYVDGGFELFNLRHDLSETRNLAARYPMRAEQLRSRLSAWRKSVGAQMPTPNPEYDPARAHEFWKAGRLMEVVRD
ncbi:MAG: hypothetical protein CMJ48_13445 [Planctomycetaceae bacterium]|nr:hypothetical protein [Planctomycetaceae bacterium]